MTGAAWLSSARAVKCTVKSDNERNPHHELLCLMKLTTSSSRKAGMTSNQHGPYALGNTRATMGNTKGLPNRKMELIPSKLPPVQIEVCNSTS